MLLIFFLLQVIGSLRISLQCIVGVLAGGASVAEALGVIDR